ncbi:hypothetical protein DACRYDRAFT_21868 [Dacryopinax primogenitus]|uniref:SCP2 domain-containing protein n=1 Tax=Dacryopinax primogenitus (strain DJM 731) TaxID=1858805 RepID=M5G890_DACPD|nr:uncharacterized protein DACRYDRAFT_21868 [Dacryopinax primogenitus]EJU02082.1 hypothetical protein DACRYDRAFT_21868 [Dacryopinax primogenitus]
MAGKNLIIECDVALIHAAYLLTCLVVEDKRLSNNAQDPEAQAIAEAIAAVQANNRIRKNSSLPPLTEFTMPFMTMKGAEPTMYTITVTADLLSAIETGSYPDEAVVVKRAMPSWKVAGQFIVGNNTGMEALNRRRIIMGDLDAFRRLVRELRRPLHPMFA